MKRTKKAWHACVLAIAIVLAGVSFSYVNPLRAAERAVVLNEEIQEPVYIAVVPLSQDLSEGTEAAEQEKSYTLTQVAETQTPLENTILDNSNPGKVIYNVFLVIMCGCIIFWGRHLVRKEKRIERLRGKIKVELYQKRNLKE